MFLFLSDILPEVELLDQMLVLFLIFLRNLHAVLHSGFMVYLPLNGVQVFSFLNILAGVLALLFLRIAILTGMIR